MSLPDPWGILGVKKGADKSEVKKAYRQRALQTHPDLNPSPAAAAEYDKVYRAAQALLNERGRQSTRVRGQQPFTSQAWKAGFDQYSRRPSFPIYFSAACLVGGCVIFAGAIHAHKLIFDGYSYHILEEVEKRKEFPSPLQQRINALLMEQREEQLMEKRS